LSEQSQPAWGAADPETEKTSVVVADGHPLYRAGVMATINAHPGLEVAGDAGDATTALEAIARLRPDVAVVAMRMPGGGLSVIHGVRERRLPTRVVCLASLAEGADVYAAVGAGARGYVTKDAAGASLIEAILAVARGGTWFSPSAEMSLVSAVHSHGDGESTHLTTREREILELVADGRSNGAIAGELHLSPDTVKSHLRNIFEKLGVTNRTAAVAQALRQSLMG